MARVGADGIIQVSQGDRTDNNISITEKERLIRYNSRGNVVPWELVQSTLRPDVYSMVYHNSLHIQS